MNLLKIHRGAVGLTQGELGSKLSVSKAAVSRWESGDDKPKPSHLVKLARVLGVSAVELSKFFEVGPAAYGQMMQGIRTVN